MVKKIVNNQSSTINRLVLFGTGTYTLSVAQALKKDFELEVFSAGREKNPLFKFCQENNIPCTILTSIDNPKIIEKIKKFNAEIALVASFKFILPKKILDLFLKGVLNIHPSLLPKYRGATPGQSAILNGDESTGVSIIKLDEKMDHGPVLWQKIEEIKENDTAESLYLRLFSIAANNINGVVENYLKNRLNPVSQADNKATYIEKLTRESGKIDIDNPPSPEIIDKMIRAYFPWPGAWTEIKNTRIKLLPEQKLQVEGKKPINLEDFKNGYPQIYDKIAKLFK